MEQPEVTSQPTQSYGGASTGTSLAASSIVATAGTLPAFIIIPCPGGYLVVRRTRQLAVRSASSPITQSTATRRLHELLARLRASGVQRGGSAGLGTGDARPSATPVAAAPSQLPEPTAQQWLPHSNAGPALVAQPTCHSVSQESQHLSLLLAQQQQPFQWQQLAVEPAVHCSPMPSMTSSPLQPATSCSSGSSSSSASGSPAGTLPMWSVLHPATPSPQKQASRLS